MGWKETSGSAWTWHKGEWHAGNPQLMGTMTHAPWLGSCVFDGARARGTDHKIGQLNPLKRAGQPHELATMGLFLLSDEASYVNGQAIPVDGGLTAR